MGLSVQTAKLEDFCEIQGGGKLGLTGSDFVDEGIPAYGAGGVNGQVSDVEFNQPGIVLSSIGARCGKSFYAQGKWTSLANTQIILPDPKQADSRFVWYQLNDESSWHRSGTAQPFIKPADVKSRRVYLPPIEDQRRIAGILDHADALRAKRREAIANLDALTQSIFFDMSTAANSQPKAVPLTDVFWFQEGPGVRNWQFQESGIKLLNVANILRSGTLDLDKTSRHLATEEVRQKYSHFLVDVGDLVIASSGITFDTDGLLRTRGAFVESDDLPLCMNTSTIRFKSLSNRGSLTFLKAWLDSDEFRTQITRLVTGTAQQNFGPSHLKALTITLPLPEVQERFASRMREIEKLQVEHRRQQTSLDILFASLQQRAFSGQL